MTTRYPQLTTEGEDRSFQIKASPALLVQYMDKCCQTLYPYGHTVSAKSDLNTGQSVQQQIRSVLSDEFFLISSFRSALQRALLSSYFFPKSTEPTPAIHSVVNNLSLGLQANYNCSPFVIPLTNHSFFTWRCLCCTFQTKPWI